MKRVAPALIALVFAACGRADADTLRRQAEADAGRGRCSLEEPGIGEPMYGNAVYYADRTPTARAEDRTGSVAILLTCRIAGQSAPAVTIILPNLSDTVPATGKYFVTPDSIIPADVDVSRLAWAHAEAPAGSGVIYRGQGGEVVLERAENGVIIGSYLVALRQDQVARPGQATGWVLGGSFVAARNTLPLSAALPREGRP